MAIELLTTEKRLEGKYDPSVWSENGLTLQYMLGRMEYRLSGSLDHTPEPLRQLEMIHQCLLASGIEDQVQFNSAEAVKWVVERFNGQESTRYYLNTDTLSYKSAVLLHQ